MFQRLGNLDPSRTKFARRTVLLGGLQGVGFALLGARLYQLQVMDGRIYGPLAENNRITTQSLAPQRGRILDRKGTHLADNIEAFQAQVVPALTADLGATLDIFAKIYPLPPGRRAKLLKQARGQPKNLPLLLANNLSWYELTQININAPRLPGVITVASGKRHVSSVP